MKQTLCGRSGSISSWRPSSSSSISLSLPLVSWFLPLATRGSQNFWFVSSQFRFFQENTKVVYHWYHGDLNDIQWDCIITWMTWLLMTMESPVIVEFLLIVSLIPSRTTIQHHLFLESNSILRFSRHNFPVIKYSREFNSYELFLSGCYILIRKNMLQLGATSRAKTSGTFIRSFPTYGVYPVLTK